MMEGILAVSVGLFIGLVAFFVLYQMIVGHLAEEDKELEYMDIAGGEDRTCVSVFKREKNQVHFLICDDIPKPLKGWQFLKKRRLKKSLEYLKDDFESILKEVKQHQEHAIIKDFEEDRVTASEIRGFKENWLPEFWFPLSPWFRKRLIDDYFDPSRNRRIR